MRIRRMSTMPSSLECSIPRQDLLRSTSPPPLSCYHSRNHKSICRPRLSLLRKWRNRNKMKTQLLRRKLSQKRRTTENQAQTRQTHRIRARAKSSSVLIVKKASTRCSTLHNTHEAIRVRSLTNVSYVVVDSLKSPM